MTCYFPSLAHQGAYKVGFLHRDLSPGNIVIYEGCGYLIDWDMVKPIRVVTPRRMTRTVCVLCSP